MDPVPEASDACASTYVAPEPTVINLGEQLQCEPAPAPEPGKRATQCSSASRASEQWTCSG
jgi:hypothetical protein